jgi:hypothetical protein
VRIAVNVSPRQLRNRSFIDDIKQAIGIDARAAAALELEFSVCDSRTSAPAVTRISTSLATGPKNTFVDRRRMHQRRGPGVAHRQSA